MNELIKKLPYELMKKDMESLNFVNWDRFVVFEEKDNNKVELYGWIKREDTHEDFIILIYNPEKSKWITSFITSSKKYDKKIFEFLNGKGKLFKCNRVEDSFKIKNMIKLKKEKIK